MKKVLSCCLLGVVLVSGAFGGCSEKKEPAAEKSAIQKMTEETAKEAVNQIRTPIDKPVPLRSSRARKTKK